MLFKNMWLFREITVDKFMVVKPFLEALSSRTSKQRSGHVRENECHCWKVSKLSSLTPACFLYNRLIDQFARNWCDHLSFGFPMGQSHTCSLGKKKTLLTCEDILNPSVIYMGEAPIKC